MSEPKKLRPEHFGYIARNSNDPNLWIFKKAVITWIAEGLIIIRMGSIKISYSKGSGAWIIRHSEGYKSDEVLYSSEKLSVELFKLICKENHIKL